MKTIAVSLTLAAGIILTLGAVLERVRSAAAIPSPPPGVAVPMVVPKPEKRYDPPSYVPSWGEMYPVVVGRSGLDMPGYDMLRAKADSCATCHQTAIVREARR